MAGLRGAGKVYLSINNSGTYGGWLDMANIASFTMGNEGADTTSIKSTAPDNYGAVIGSSTTPGDDTISITLNVPNRKNLTTMLLGTDTTVTVSGATITDEQHVARKGAHHVLAKRNLTSIDRVDTAAGSGGAALTAGTDYTVPTAEELENGLLFIPSTSSVTEGASIYVDYTHLAYSGYKIEARTSSSIQAKMLFVGENLDSGERIRVVANNIELSPEGDFSLISADGEFLEFTLAGLMKVPDGETVPFEMQVMTHATS